MAPPELNIFRDFGFVLNTERLRAAEEKLRNERGVNTYSPMKFLKAVRHSFGATNKRYFDQVQDILTDDPLPGDNSDSEEEQEHEDQVEHEEPRPSEGNAVVSAWTKKQILS